MLQDVEHVLDGGTHDAARVDAGMAVEILVFGGRERVDDQPRHEGDRHEDAPLAGIFAQDRAVAGIDAGGDRRLVVLQRFDARKVRVSE